MALLTCIQHCNYINCALPKGSKRHYFAFSLFTDYDISPSYAAPVKFVAATCT